MMEVIYFILIFLLVFSIGSKIIKGFKLNLDFIEILVFSSAIGFGILSYTTFALGMLGMMYKWIFLTMIITPLFFCSRELKYFFYNIILHLKKIKSLGYFDRALVIIFILFLTSNMIASLSPPYLWDEVAYNIALPKVYARHNQIIPVYDEFKSNYPFNINMLFTAGLLIGNASLAKLFMFGYGTLLALAIFAFARKYFSLRAALLAAVVYYTMPMISNHISSTYTDIGVAFYIFAAYYAFYAWFKNNNVNWFLLSAVMTGLSLASKHTALYYLPPMFLGIIYKLFFKDRNHFFNIYKKIIVYFLIAFLLVSPWYIKSYVYTGNPIYPYANSLFLSQYFDPVQSQNIISSNFLDSVGERTLLNFLAKFWDLTMHSSRYGMLLGFGPIFLAFVPLIVLFRKVDDAAKYLLAYSIISIGVWFFGPQVLRYLMIYPMLSVVSGSVIDSMLHIKKIKIVVALTLASTLFFNAALWYGANSVKLPYAFGLESEQSFYLKLKDDNGYNVFKFANENLPKSSKLLLFREYRGYLSDLDYVIGDPLTQKVVDYSKIDDGREMYKELKQVGITHVFINTKIDFVGRFNPNQPPHYSEKILDLMDEMLELHGRLLISDNGVYLYELVQSK